MAACTVSTTLSCTIPFQASSTTIYCLFGTSVLPGLCSNTMFGALQVTAAPGDACWWCPTSIQTTLQISSNSATSSKLSLTMLTTSTAYQGILTSSTQISSATGQPNPNTTSPSGISSTGISSGGISRGAAVGMGIVILLLLLIIGIIVFFFLRHRRTSRVLGGHRQAGELPEEPSARNELGDKDFVTWHKIEAEQQIHEINQPIAASLHEPQGGPQIHRPMSNGPIIRQEVSNTGPTAAGLAPTDLRTETSAPSNFATIWENIDAQEGGPVPGYSVQPTGPGVATSSAGLRDMEEEILRLEEEQERLQRLQELKTRKEELRRTINEARTRAT